MVKAICILLLLFIVQRLKAQEPCFFKIGYEQGLPSKETYDLFQDKKGFIWIGHNNGLSRYDGYGFKNYSNKNLSGKALSKLITDKDDRIWCINFSGQICYIENDSLYILDEYEKLKEPDFPLYDIDKKTNTLYTSSTRGLFVYHITTKKAELIKQPLLKDWDCKQLLLKENGDLHFSTSTDGIWCYRNNKLIKLNRYPDCEIAANFYPVPGKEALFLDRSKSKFFIVDNNTMKELPSSIPFGTLNTFSTIGTTNYINTSTGTFTYKVSNNIVYLTPFSANPYISDMIRDQEGNYWLSTLNDGIYIIPNLQFKNFRLSTADDYQLAGICKDDNNQLMIGSKQGNVYLFDCTTEKVVRSFALEPGRIINKIVYDGFSGKYFISGNKLFQTNKPGDKASGFVPENPNIKDICIDGRCMLTASPIGLSIYELPGQSPKTFIKNIIANTSLKNPVVILKSNGISLYGVTIGPVARCRSLMIDSLNEAIWACYTGGLKLYTTSGTIEPKLNNKPVYATKVISCKDQNIVGTVQNGILIFKGTAFSKQVNEEQGLLNNNIISMKASHDTIWILSNSGIQRTNINFDHFDNFTMEDGLFCDDVVDFEVCNGKVWITSGNGLISFPSNTIASNNYKPDIFLNYIKVNDVPIDIKNIIDLEPSENNLAIGFQSFPYKPGKHFKYKYRLINTSNPDSAWIITDRHGNNIRFFSLNPDHYTFEAIAVNEDGVESPVPLKLEFTILKPVYQRWWFVLTVIIFIALAIGITAYFRIRYVQRQSIIETEKARLEKNLTNAQLSAIKAQMNPHFLFNALSSIQTLFLKNDQKNANENLVKFSDLMRTILEMSGKQHITLEEELAMLRLYLDVEIARFDSEISYDIVVTEGIPAEEIVIPPMVIQPFVENIFKHAFPGKTGNKKINLGFKTINDQLIVAIEDNGWGRKHTEKQKMIRKATHRSFSTSANQKRIELLNKNRNLPIEIDIIDKGNEQSPEGTLVVIKFPIEKEFDE
ncbi:MAG TPA: histidine kinase [Bacteroidia bacterium]